jgi:hypothetical protein
VTSFAAVVAGHSGISTGPTRRNVHRAMFMREGGGGSAVRLGCAALQHGRNRPVLWHASCEGCIMHVTANRCHVTQWQRLLVTGASETDHHCVSLAPGRREGSSSISAIVSPFHVKISQTPPDEETSKQTAFGSIMGLKSNPCLRYDKISEISITAGDAGCLEFKYSVLESYNFQWRCGFTLAFTA